ncbi:MAG: hypothetical protein ACHQRM_04560 [Bacteroidia bacterium]
MPLVLKCLLVVFPALLSSSLFSQTLSSSPYSRYGLGDLQGVGLAQNFALGGAGYAWRNDSSSANYINITNPASYSSTRVTTVELGMLSNTTQFQTMDTRFVLNNTSFSYLSVAVPLKPWWGLSFGVMPYSTVGYNIHTQQNRDTVGLIDYFYQGQGGINKAYLGSGMKLLKKRFTDRTGTDLSCGFNANFEFGSISNTRHVVYDSPNNYDTRIDESIRVHDVAWDFGMQFRFQIRSKMGLNPKLKTGCAYIDHKHYDSVAVYKNCRVDSVVPVKYYTHRTDEKTTLEKKMLRKGLSRITNPKVACGCAYVNPKHVDTVVVFTGCKIDSVVKNKYFSHHTDDTVFYEALRTRHQIDPVNFTFGLTFSPAMGLSGASDLLARNYLPSGSVEVFKDTLINAVNQPGIFKIPAKVGLGISIGQSYKWNVLADYSYQQWAGYSYGGVSGGLQNSLQASLGFQFQPGLTGTYFHIVRYRMGLRYNQTYLDLQGSKLTETGVSFGLALPVAVSRVKKRYDLRNTIMGYHRPEYSIVNLSVELGQRGTTSNGLIKETYGRIILGFTINDRWFQRFKYND